FMGFNVSTNPSVISFGGGINNSIGFFKIFGGLKKKKSFFAFLSYTLFYSHDKKHSKSIINNKLPSTQKQVVHDLVNINTADESKLITLPNIGLKTAKKVIKYREENGLFYECDELMEVSGIGIKKYEKLKRLITVGNVDINKSLSNIRRWTMKEFTDIGFSPSLSLRLVLFIQDRERFNSIEDLLKVNGFDKYKLILLKKTLKNYEQKRKNH
ncbi:MAG: ComEA family DNA-binding protein, partial [Spirochaetota bacterium]|nr:ComEA family DNA-binding protein [Spirochaetota bacterium]